MVDSPCISSFVIRIIEEAKPQSSASHYRGIIRHVQSDQELSFTSWVDVESFIQQYVPIHQMVSPQDSPQITTDHKEV